MNWNLLSVMEAIRKYHNDVKRTLIQNTVPPGARVLDVGCGVGGDVNKWRQISAVRVDMCDPDETSVLEAQRRSAGWSTCRVFCGDITECPHELYDVICYNFSIQYIFQTRDLFTRSVRAIRDRLGQGGSVMGCVPNSDRIIMHPDFKDSLGNFMVRKMETTGFGGLGEKLYVQLVDTPFYKNGPRSEPIAYKDLLVAEFKKHCIELVCWTPFAPIYEISQMYAYFIFKSY